MWNSPRTLSEIGKRYSLDELSALLLTVDEILCLTDSAPVADHVEERILRPLERGELVYALQETFEALMGDAPIPEDGHPGIHQALIAELLNQAFGRVVAEIEVGEGESSNREFVWRSVDRLLVREDPEESALGWILKDAGLSLSDPEPYRSDKLTIDHWRQLLVDGCLFDEFLEDDDWRIDSVLDLDPRKAEELTKLMGLDLSVVHALPHTPSKEEAERAERYLLDLVRKSEEQDDVRQPFAPETNDPDIPF